MSYTPVNNASPLSHNNRISSTNADIRVDGNQITWPDNGWYEVQSATSHNTISEGGLSAALPHGTYNLINHTTGERFENISVPGSSQGQSRNSLLAADGGSKNSETNEVDNPASQDESQQSEDTEKADSSNRPVVVLSPGNLIWTDTITTTTVTPEDSWGETLVEAGGQTLAGGPVAGALQLGAGIDIDSESTQVPAFSPIAMLVQAIVNLPHLLLGTSPSGNGSNNNNENDLNGDGFVSGAESAETGNFGTAEEGEFGGTPTAPAAEPVTTTPASDPNSNSDSDTDNGAGGGGVSSGPTSAQSAENGGFGNNEEGEFGGTPTAASSEPASQPTSSQSTQNGNDLGSSDSDSSGGGGSNNSSGSPGSDASTDETSGYAG